MARMCLSCKINQGKMKNQKVVKILLLYNILVTIYREVNSADSRLAFIHVDGDLRYLMDGVSVDMHEFVRKEDTSAISFTDLSEENLNAYASPIAFHPPMLNFHNHPVGMPHMERVIIQNLSPDTSIHMLSISGNTLHTHCSFFQQKVVPPGGNTSFDVVLLVREEGAVEDTLFIHTSLGSFKFQVSAVGIPNPYRLKPFVGVKMPLNSSYSPTIYMHNPHSTTLQLTEMYSTSGDLHLELPDGDNEMQKSLWEIPPYETKAVIKTNFIARIEKNHTSFIRIKTNSTCKDYLLLPVEVDVTSVPGIYCPIEVLDFGVLRTQDEAKTLTLSLLNSGQKHVHIVNVIATPVNEAVDVKFVPAKIPPDTIFSTEVATITFNPSKALHSKQCCGKIVIKSKNNQYKLQIPYQVKLLKGSLGYNKNNTKFYIGQQNNSSFKEFNLTNNFNVVIIIYSVSLPKEAEEHFSVKFTEPVILKPSQSSIVAYLALKSSIPDSQLTSYLRLHTNISHFDIPLLCFTGRLKVFLPHSVNESFIDFGTLGMGDKRTVIFAVINENPVDVNLKFWGSNASKTYVELVGVDKGNASTLAWRQNFSTMARSLILKPQHYAIFRIGITAPNHEGLFQDQAFVETQYEKINVPFSLRTAEGALRVDEIFFENSFPGKISTQSLYVESTFSHPMTITGITTVPEDARFVFDSLKRVSPILHPNSKNMVGKIHFDHRKYCKQKCYSGLPTTTSMGHQWLLGMALPSDVGDMDRDLFRTLCKRWQSVLDLEERITNITLRIDTTEVKGYLLKSHASLQWPRLFSRYKLKFPVTQIGNRTVKDFTLENPSSLPILIQVVPVSLYPNPTNILNALKEKYGHDYGFNVISKDTEEFTLEDLEENNPNPDNHIPAYRKSLEEFFGIKSHKKSIAMLLTPGMRVRIQVGFTPIDDTLKTSMILIRNNLTVMDALLVQGQGGYGQIKFGNISPGSDSVLMFELTEHLLKDCDGSSLPKYTVPNFTVRRAFTARNTGALPIYIKGFDINGKVCQGYGFRILNCQGFELKPNSSRKVDIAYTPDFSMTRVERILNIHTNQGQDGQVLHYRLLATVPKLMLSFCSKSLPRPYWEMYTYLCFTVLSLLMLMSVTVCGYLDSQRLLHNTFFPFITVGITTEKIEKENVFDLNAICSAPMENSSYVKQGYQNDCKKRKESVSDNISASDNTTYNSMRSVGTSFPKRKDLLTSKELEPHVMENKSSKKKNAKLKSSENYYLEPELMEIKKSQPRNSWTRFLKPPFSFHSCSNINNKPSVATQTSLDSSEDSSKSLKELDIIGDESLNYFINIENNHPNNKPKNKNENKYMSGNYFRKDNYSPPEEETSSTTTETSTTDSDISEKDHRLPDICVTSKPQKNKHLKNKTKESNILSNSQNASTSMENIVSHNGNDKNFKAQNHKQIKIESEKLYNSNSIRTNALELPYKLKSLPEEEKKVLDSASKSSSNYSLNKETHNDISETLKKPSLQQGFTNYLWSKSPETAKPTLSLESFSKHPSTYSAAVSKDVLSNEKEKNILICQVGKNATDSSKTESTRPKQSVISQPPNKNSHNQSSFHQSSWNVDNEQVNSQDKLSGSKLNCWLLKSNEQFTTPTKKEENLLVINKPNILKYDNPSGQSIPWNEDPHMPISSSFINTEPQIRPDTYNKQSGVYNDWPGFDLTPIRESFWDKNYRPNSDSWTDKPVSDQLDSDISAINNASPNLTLNNIWDLPLPSDSCRPGSSSWLSSCDAYNPIGNNGMQDNIMASEETFIDRTASTGGEFDPFHTSSALWIAPQNDKDMLQGTSGANTWSFSLFSDPNDVLNSDSTRDYTDDKK